MLRHTFADALGSIAVVVFGVVIIATGWDPIHPLASLAVAALILASFVRLIAGPIEVLRREQLAGARPPASGEPRPASGCSARRRSSRCGWGSPSR